MIINRAPARGGRGGAGRGLACSERGGRARPRGSSKPGGLLGGGGGQAGFDRELPVAEFCAHSALLDPAVQPLGMAGSPELQSVRLCAPETRGSSAPGPRGAALPEEAPLPALSSHRC